LTEHDLRKPLPDGAVMVYPGEAQIGHWRGTQVVEEARVGSARIERATLDLVEQVPQLRRSHKGCFSLTLPTSAVYR
jgi:hypothetical protein